MADEDEQKDEFHLPKIVVVDGRRFQVMLEEDERPRTIPNAPPIYKLILYEIIEGR